MRAMMFIRSMILSSMRSVPRTWLVRFMNGRFIAPFYHAVASQPRPHLSALYTPRTPAEFERDLDKLLTIGRPAKLHELVDSVVNERELSRNTFFISFDDGLREAYEVAVPILKRKGVPATFFLISGLIGNSSLMYRHKASLLVNAISDGKYQKIVRQILIRHQKGLSPQRELLNINLSESWVLDEIATACDVDFERFLREERPYLMDDEVTTLIRGGFTIGSHTVSHPHPQVCSESVLVDEILSSTCDLQRRYDMNLTSFAFPFSDLNIPLSTFTAIADSGKIALTFGSSGFRMDSANSNVQRIAAEVPNHDILDIIAAEQVIQKIRSLLGAGTIRRK